MTALTNREKNIMHEARRDAKVRPVTPSYNFENLESVVRSWISDTEILQEEICSPYYGA